MTVDTQSAQSLAQKLQQFRGGLNGGEQEALDGLLRTFAGATQNLGARGGLDAAASDLDELNTKVRSLTDEGQQEAVTPTVTTITITTTVASHPTIGCN